MYNSRTTTNQTYSVYLKRKPDDLTYWYKGVLALLLICLAAFSKQASAKTTGGTTVPSCEFSGATTVCPGSSNEYKAKATTLPSGHTYKWSVTGGTIVGADNKNCVTIKAGTGCNTKFTLKLRIKKGETTVCECSKDITVKDVTKPEIKCSPDITVQCDKDIPAIDLSSVKATDNCGGTVTITCEGDKVEQDPKNPCLKTITRKYKATDKCGNYVYGTQKIVVNDKTPPVIQCAPDITVQCDKDVPACDVSSVRATDNCGGTVKVTCEGDKVEQDPKNPCIKKITRTYKATDKCGNCSYAKQIITVNDKTPPEIKCAADITVECEKDVPAANVSTVKATDNCGREVKITFEGDRTEQDPGNSCIKKITRTYKATDKCGNYAYAKQIIIVHDKTAPEIKCAADITVQCDKDIPACDISTVKATDNCGEVKVTCEGDKVEQDPRNPCLKKIIRTYKATDKCGNYAYAKQTFIVHDKTAPYIECTKEITVECEKDVPVCNISSVRASDNCGEVKITCEGDKVEWNPWFPCVKKIIRTYKATDKCGNYAFAKQLIIVNDKTAPTIECPKDITVQCESEIPRINISSVKAWDNCSEVKVTCEGDKVEWNPWFPCIKKIIRTYKATDKCGNCSYAKQTIIVNDKTAPYIECPKDITVYCEKEVPRFNCDKIKAWDNCGGIVKVTFEGDKYEKDKSFNWYGSSRTVILRTYKATDKCGNTSYCCQKITIEPSKYSKCDGKDKDKYHRGAPENGNEAGIVSMGKSAIAAYPNPYTDQVNFTIVSPVSGKAVLEVYNNVGQKLATAYKGQVSAGAGQTVKYRVPVNQRVFLMYRLTVGNKSYTGSVVPQK